MKSFFKFCIISLAICLFMEIFIFNMNCFHLIGGDYGKKQLDIGGEVISNNGSGAVSFEFTDLGIPVGTITIDAESLSKAYVDVSIDMSDDSHSTYRNNIASGTIIKGNAKSQTIVCNFSGNVHDLRIKINADDDELLTIKGITLNKPVPFKFSFVRFFGFFLGSVIVYCLCRFRIFRDDYGRNKDRVDIIAYFFTGVLILTAIMLTTLCNKSSSITTSFKSTTGNQITKELVDAFEARQVSLLIEPDEKLLALENPYDSGMRAAEDVGSYAWDHLLYNGKYYSYYGIAPVLLLFLPYHVITGYYFPSAVAVCLFGCIGILFLTKTYLCFVKKFFKNTRASIILMGLVMMQLVTGIWFCFPVPNFYEIAQTSGFACVTVGAWFLLDSNIIGDGTIRKSKLALSSVFLSLAVLCRPTLAVYCIAALFFIYAGFKKIKKENSGHYTSYFLSALMPFVLIGSIQMAYNYMRFGSFFDFGIQYSLTINDFTSAQYHTHFALIGFFNYLFTLPSFSQDFPFLTASSVQTFRPNGYYFVATNTAIGLLWKALPLLSYGYGIKAYRLSDNPNKKRYALLLLISCIIMPCIIIFSIWESGYGARYSVDFAWQILLGALIIAFMIFNRCDTRIKKHLNRLMVVATFLCFILCFAQIYQWVGSVTTLSVSNEAAYLSLARLFEFWK